jgi:hypothetical protein
LALPGVASKRTGRVNDRLPDTLIEVNNAVYLYTSRIEKEKQRRCMRTPPEP